jgi:hypothetical protein
MNKRRFPILAAILATLLLAGLAFANGTPSINWWVIAGGGGSISGGDYAINSTIGQAAVGRVGNSTYELCSGFWCGALAVEYRIYLPVVLKNYT